MNNKAAIFMSNSRITQLSAIADYEGAEWEGTMSVVGFKYKHIGVLMADSFISGSIVGITGKENDAVGRLTINDQYSSHERVGDVGEVG